MKNKKLAVTMAEIMIVVVIVTIVAGVFLAMPKKNVSKMDRAKYYIAYDMLKKLQDEQMANDGSVKIEKSTFGDAVEKWLNTQEIDKTTNYKATLTNGMILTWNNDKTNAGSGSNSDKAEIFGNNKAYLKVTVDIDGTEGLNQNNKDIYVFHLFENGWVRPDMCYKADGTDCSSNDDENVRIVLPFRVYGFNNDGSVRNYLYNVDYNTAYDLYKCSVNTSGCSVDSNCYKDTKPCIMEAIPPLK